MTMKCVSCGKTEMVRETRDVSYTYKGQTTTIPNEVVSSAQPAMNQFTIKNNQSILTAQCWTFIERSMEPA